MNETRKSESGKLALVTGASSGIGRAVARRLARDGVGVILASRRYDRLEETKSEIQKLHPEVEAHALFLDLADRESISRVCAENKKLFDRVSILVNSAGVGKGWGKLFEADPTGWEAMFATNIKGLIGLTRLLSPSISAAGKEGYIFNISSASGRFSSLGASVYSSTKFFVSDYSRHLRKQMSATGARVTNIEPGLVETEFSNTEALRRMTPLQPEDIADIVSWCLSGPKALSLENIVIFSKDQVLGAIHRRPNASV